MKSTNILTTNNNDIYTILKDQVESIHLFEKYTGESDSVLCYSV